MAELPVWLRKSFVRAVQQAGSPLTAEELEASFVSLVERWSDPARRFHGIAHVIACLSRLEKLTAEIRHPAPTTLAMWYHGVVFDTSPAAAYAGVGGENEVRSGEIARAELVALGVPEPAANMTAELILGMRYPVATTSKPGSVAIGTAPGAGEVVQHHRRDDDLSAESVDIIALRDAHLADLAAAPQAYKKYLTEVREEYPEIPEEEFLRTRLAIIRHFLARKHLFATPGTKTWEDHARQNLTAEAGRIEARLAEFEKSASEKAGNQKAASEQAGAEKAEAGSVTEPPAGAAEAGREVEATTGSDPTARDAEAGPAREAVAGPATAAEAGSAAESAAGRAAEPHAPASTSGTMPHVRRTSIFERVIAADPDALRARPAARAEDSSSATAGETDDRADTVDAPEARRAAAASSTDASAETGLPRTDQMPRQSSSAPAPTTGSSELPAVAAPDPEAMKLSTLEWCVDQIVPRASSRAGRSDLPRNDRARREEVSTKTLEVIARRTREAQEARAQRQAREENANSPLADKQRVTEARGNEEAAGSEGAAAGR